MRRNWIWVAVAGVMAAGCVGGVGGLDGLAYGGVRVGEYPQGEFQMEMPEKVAISVSTRKTKYFLGENVLLDYEVRNTGEKTIKAMCGGLYQEAGARSTQFQVLMTDEAGKAVADPMAGQLYINNGGSTWYPEIDPGSSLFVCESLMKYRVPSKAGKYTVKVAHNLGWTARGRGAVAVGGQARDIKVAEGDARWATMTIEFVEPTEAEARGVVTAMANLPEPRNPRGKKWPEITNFTWMTAPVYLPILKELVEKGDKRPISAFQGVMTPEATGVLVAALSSKNLGCQDDAVFALRERMPMWQFTRADSHWAKANGEMMKKNQETVRVAWREEFAKPTLAWARMAIKEPIDVNKDPGRVQFAADFIGCLGEAEDVALVAEVLDRATKLANANPGAPLMKQLLFRLKLGAQGLTERGIKKPEYEGV